MTPIIPAQAPANDLFDSFALHPTILKAVRDIGYVRPTAIQMDAIPPALEGRDILACAATGSGKTAAFLLPILNGLIGKRRGTTRALVVAPTRELAAQILDDLKGFAKYTSVTSAVIYGGVGMGEQERALRSGVDVIIATPGRLLDHMQNSYAKLNGIEYLVLDEADRMLDMGFLPDIKRILKVIPRERQTFFLSATIPAPIAELSKNLLQSPVKINVARQAAPAGTIKQALYPIQQELKSALLHALLDRGIMKDVLVFTRTKHRTNRLAEYLTKAGFKTARLHGNRSMRQRMDALEGFKDGTYRVLVATDIAARGIDVEALGHVINFDVPVTPEDYIHRVGRTGRAELSGEAFTFVSPDEEAGVRAIEKTIGRKLQREMLSDFDYSKRPNARLEIPIGERLAAMRAQKARGRSNQNLSQSRNQNRTPGRGSANQGRARANGNRR